MSKADVRPPDFVPPVPTYRLIVGENCDEVEEAVNSALTAGWRLHGNLAIASTFEGTVRVTFAREMVRP